MKIGILIPVCSRKQSWTSYSDCYLAASVPSLMRTFSSDHEYVIYIGIDDDDVFFQTHIADLPGVPVIVSNCQNAPAHVWNHLANRAVSEGCDYLFQLADDVILETPGWTERFIETLQSVNNRGVVGPCPQRNYLGRKAQGKPFVLENAFVHKSHVDRFGSFYPWEIKNWYCDDWITRVYEGSLSYMFEDIIVSNRSLETGTERYTIDHPDWAACIARGKKQLRDTTKGCFSFCLYGPETDKYYKGLQRNVGLIHEHYPGWDIVVYAAPDAQTFVRSLSGVHCVPTGKEGAVNMVYRFLAVLDPDYDVVFVRDADSRVNERDQWCIQHFLDSPYSVHTTRDHPWHRYRIMGGLWGAKRGHHFKEAELMEYCEKISAGYTCDTRFLEQSLQTQNRVVYSYDPNGLFHDPTETVVVIDCPGDFCGNVILFDTDGNEYPEFTR